MKRAFRKYHRTLAIILAIPLVLTLVTGIAVSLIGEWSLSLGVSRSFLLKLHTGEIFHLEKIYPILNGIGLLGMVVTGLSMTSLFTRRPQTNRTP